jgi:hypothetical protein
LSGPEPSRRASDDRIGLCARCRNARRVESDRGSVFYRCALADQDPRFPKYPRLPVVRCAGYEPPESEARA